VFGFQKLDVYRCATRFLAQAAPLAERAPRGYGSLADQLRRAALSVPLNIADGGGRFDRDARRYYAIARGSALECAAILDAFEALAVASDDDLSEARQLLDRIVAMLTVMLRN
jgi:four helix bundle protein